MNGEALKIHIPSTTYPQFAHNLPLLSLFSVASDTKNAESEEFGVVVAKNFGAECGQVALHGRGEGNWVCAKFHHSNTTLDRWR
jgi:hypothetical protein